MTGFSAPIAAALKVVAVRAEVGRVELDVTAPPNCEHVLISEDGLQVGAVGNVEDGACTIDATVLRPGDHEYQIDGWAGYPGAPASNVVATITTHITTPQGEEPPPLPEPGDTTGGGFGLAEPSTSSAVVFPPSGVGGVETADTASEGVKTTVTGGFGMSGVSVNTTSSTVESDNAAEPVTTEGDDEGDDDALPTISGGSDDDLPDVPDVGTDDTPEVPAWDPPHSLGDRVDAQARLADEVAASSAVTDDATTPVPDTTPDLDADGGGEQGSEDGDVPDTGEAAPIAPDSAVAGDARSVSEPNALVNDAAADTSTGDNATADSEIATTDAHAASNADPADDLDGDGTPDI